MTFTAQVANAPRRAALLVHAMPQGDRQWLLASLPPHQRVELEELLAELRELGIPPDEQLLREVVDAPIAVQPAAVPADPLEHLAPGQVAVLAALLRKEPPQLVATLLAARDWPWKEAFLRQLEPQHALVVAAAQPRRAKEVQQAVCAAVLRQLQQATPPAQAALASPPWRRLLAIRWKGRKA